MPLPGNWFRAEGFCVDLNEIAGWGHLPDTTTRAGRLLLYLRGGGEIPVTDRLIINALLDVLSIV